MDIVKNILKDPYNNIKDLSIKELEDVITFAADKYYNTKTPVVSDAVYDLLIDFLRHQKPKSKVLSMVGAKPKNKVKLDYWLGSMEKIKPDNIKEFDKWTNKYKPPYYISDKLDGVSGLVIYREDGKINLYTRGTADEGTDITNLVKYLDLPNWKTISNTKLFKINNVLALRGELVIKRSVFNKNWKSTMKNARNTVSGLVNSKIVKPTLANDTDIVFYEIVEPNMTIEKQLLNISKMGFKTVNYKVFNKIDFNILSNYLKERRDSSDYDIDGVIVTNNDVYERNTKKNPEYAFAYKDVLEDQVGKTKIIEIEWNISKDGYIKPTLLLEPIEISGVIISRATGNNARHVVDNNLGASAIVEVVRSGDVIPKIQRVIKPASTVKLPPGKWHWNATNIDIISDELDNSKMLVKRIYFFFSTLNVKGLGEKIVEKLVNAKIDSIIKILSSNESDFIKVEGFKEKSASNLYKSIQSSIVNVPLYKLMAASNILGHGIGEEKIKLVLDNYPNLLNEKWTDKEFIEKLISISGFEEKTSKLFVSNFNEFKNFYNSIKKYISIKKETKEMIVNEWTDKTIVMSGFRSEELKEFLEKSGAKVSNSISKNTDILIVKDDKVTSKVEKANELGIKIIQFNKIKIK